MVGELVCGVGLNDVLDPTVRTESVDGKRLVVWSCPFYRRWLSMLRRCYSEVSHKKDPSYQDCSVCPEWLLFSNFKAWMQDQDWENNQLDKDLLIRGNKEYGPNTCVFVSPKVNSFIADIRANSGGWLVGAYFNKRDKMFQALCRCALTGKQIYLGSYLTEEAAHSAWLVFKLDQARILAGLQTDKRVATALINRYENYYRA